MKKIKTFSKWNSVNEEKKLLENELSQILENEDFDENKWYEILSQSYESYKNVEEREKNPTGKMREEQKFWIFEYPIHDIMRNTGCLSILESITSIMKKFGYGESADLMHYMLNDFSIEWENSLNGSKPAFQFLFMGPSYNWIDKSGQLNVGDPNSPMKVPALTLKIYSEYPVDFKELSVGIKEDNFCVFPEISSMDIPDVLIDIYKIVKRANS